MFFLLILEVARPPPELQDLEKYGKKNEKNKKIKNIEKNVFW